MIVTAKGEETLRAAIGSDLRNLRALCHEPPPLELRRPLYLSRGGGALSVDRSSPSINETTSNLGRSA